MKYQTALKERAIEVAIGGDCPACQASNLDCIGKSANGSRLFYCHSCEWREWGTPVELDDQSNAGQDSTPDA